MIEINGSFGEGGGQILRTALTLSVISGQPFSLKNIRSSRPQPGLKPQHIKAIEAAAAISRAQFNPVSPGGRELRFEPRELTAGNYRFDIGTAGATGLVLQTILLPLTLAEKPSNVIVTGGTHVPWSPCFHYLAWHWCHFLRQIGFSIDLEMKRAGFYPPGGGEIHATVNPRQSLQPLSLTGRGKLVQIRGLSTVAKLPRSIAERQQARALHRLSGHEEPVTIDIETVDALSAGTYLILVAEFEQSQYCVAALGAKGKRAETVADEAIDDFEQFLATGAAIDAHLADQLLIPLAMVPGTSRLRTATVTTHLQTNAEVIRRFLPVTIDVDGSPGEPGDVTIAPKVDPSA